MKNEPKITTNDRVLKKFGDMFVEPIRNGIYKKKEFHGHGVSIINMGELFAHDFISDQEMKLVELSAEERMNYLVQDGDLLFARRSYVLEGSGKCSIVVSPSKPTTFESSIIRARLDQKEANPLFYYYVFRSPLGRALISSIATRTAVSGIRGGDLSNLKLPYPQLLSQNKIASILSAYDDLIENNNRRIKILEEMAQAIYKEWFVNFRFPGYKKVKMVKSKLGLIPEGWEVKKLKDIAEVNKRNIGKSDALDEIFYVDIASVSTGSIDHIEPYQYEDAPGRARRRVGHGDIIWSSVRPNRKSFALIINPEPNLIVSTGFGVITAMKVPYTYLYQAVTTDEFVGYLTNNARGAAYPAVNTEDYERADILMTPANILDKFHGVVEPLFLLKDDLQKKNNVLRGTRDLLLPKLISGEINVEGLKIDTEQ